MNRLITRLAIFLGTAVVPATAALAQTGGLAVSEICAKPEYADLSKKLWEYVQEQDKTEIYIAFLEECGDAPLMAEYVKLAREVVIERTNNFTDLPKKIYVFNDVKDDKFNAYYVA